MKAAVLTALAVFAALLDLTLGSRIALLGGHPSFAAALVVAWAVLRRRDETMLLAPVAGLALGLLGNEPLGASVIGLAPAAFLGWMQTPEAAERRFGLALAAGLVGTGLYVVIVAACEALVDRTGPPIAPLLRETTGAALLTTLLVAVIYLPLARTAWQPRVRGQFRRY